MKSLDTNILLYSLNADCPEYEKSRDCVNAALAKPDDFVIAEQVFFELYSLLRNPKVMEKPLKATQAFEAVRFFRELSGWEHCAFESSFFEILSRFLGDPLFPARRTFDTVLAVTLSMNGVRTFYTRNVKEFKEIGLFETVDPLIGEPAVSLVPVQKEKQKRELGFYAGKIAIADDFDAPLDDFNDYQ